jgi:hypothetical protein
LDLYGKKEVIFTYSYYQYILSKKLQITQSKETEGSYNVALGIFHQLASNHKEYEDEERLFCSRFRFCNSEFPELLQWHYDDFRRLVNSSGHLEIARESYEKAISIGVNVDFCQNNLNRLESSTYIIKDVLLSFT